jgi:putative acyl-CoA dehydrogenase
MWMSMRLAHALDRSEADPAERLLSRICTPVAKYWACKRAPHFVAEALECHGGNGFIEDHPIARLYREAPLNGIWEGTGNVICLDVLRSVQREPETVAVFLDEVGSTRGADPRLDAFTRDVADRLGRPDELETGARRVIEMMAFALQASLMVRYSTPATADAFCATRLDGDWGRAFGTMPKGIDTRSIVDRARIAGE